MVSFLLLAKFQPIPSTPYLPLGRKLLTEKFHHEFVHLGPPQVWFQKNFSRKNSKIYVMTDVEIAFIPKFLERLSHSFSHDLHILVMQKLREKTRNRGISFFNMKNQTLSSHAQLESCDTKLHLLAKGVAPTDSKSHYQSRFNLDSGESTLDIKTFMGDNGTYALK